MTDLIGKNLGPYKLLERIGEGGMAVVYKGYQSSLGRYVAVKVLRGELARDEGFVARFRREALAVAKLSHPNILHVYDAGASDGVYYIVMAYADGGSLKSLIEKGPLQPEFAVSIAAQLAAALDHAHQQGLIHRDVKPSNVLMGRDMRPLLTDFGIAKVLYEATRLTRTGTSIGTPEYMAPEHALMQPVDGRTDIYALGIVLYEMLTGQVPFTADTPVVTLYRHVNEAPRPPRQVNSAVPRWLEAVIARALAKQPGDRYQRALDLAEELEQRRTPGLLRGAKTPRRGIPLARKGASAGTRVAPAAKPASPPKAPSEQPAPRAPDAAATRLAGAARRGRSRPQERRKRPAPLLLAAMGVLLVALLVGGGFFLAGGPGGGEEAAASPTAAVVLPVDTGRPSATVGALLAVSSPTPSPSATAPPTPTRTGTPTRTPRPTRTGMPTAARAPSRTPTRAATATASPSPTPQATASLPTATEKPIATGTEYPAPTLLAPPDGAQFALGEEIVLRWQSVGQLAADEYYRVTVAYAPASDPGATWQDESPWVKETRWTLSEHDYLPGLSADGEFRWSVRVLRQTGSDANGDPAATPASPASTVWTLLWGVTSDDGGDGGDGGRDQPSPVNPPQPVATNTPPP